MRSGARWSSSRGDGTSASAAGSPHGAHPPGAAPSSPPGSARPHGRRDRHATILAMGRWRGAGIIVLVVLLAGCAGLGDVLTQPPAVQRPNDPARLVGHWVGEVDLTFPERTLVVHSVTRKS